MRLGYAANRHGAKIEVRLGRDAYPSINVCCRFGRRKVILVAMFIGILHSICLPWVTNFYLFLTIILVITASFNTQYLTTFVFSTLFSSSY